jgi:hypothetical protein
MPRFLGMSTKAEPATAPRALGAWFLFVSPVLLSVIRIPVVDLYLSPDTAFLSMAFSFRLNGW